MPPCRRGCCRRPPGHRSRVRRLRTARSKRAMFSSSLKVGTTTMVRTACDRTDAELSCRLACPVRSPPPRHRPPVRRLAPRCRPAGCSHRNDAPGRAFVQRRMDDLPELHAASVCCHRTLRSRRWSPSPAGRAVARFLIAEAAACPRRLPQVDPVARVRLRVGRWPDTLPTGATSMIAAIGNAPTTTPRC